MSEIINNEGQYNDAVIALCEEVLNCVFRVGRSSEYKDNIGYIQAVITKVTRGHYLILNSANHLAIENFSLHSDSIYNFYDDAEIGKMIRKNGVDKFIAHKVHCALEADVIQYLWLNGEKMYNNLWENEA